MTGEELERLMNTYGDYIARICYLYLKNLQLAEDATQEVFIKAYTHMEGFKQESSEKTWLSSIAINVCKNYLRTSWFRKVNVGIMEEAEEGEEVDMGQNLVEQVEQSELLSQVIDLPTKYKEVILLHYYQGLKVNEIASVLHISEGTVKMRLNRARKKMSANLREVEAYGEM